MLAGILWFCSAGILVAMLYLFASPPVKAVFVTLEIDLPALTTLFLKAGSHLYSVQGMVAVVLVLGLSFVPFVVARPERRAAKIYAALGVLALITAALVWVTTGRLVTKLQERLQDAGLETPFDPPPGPWRDR